MKLKTYKSLGLTLNISVPSDAAEFDRMAKKEGACAEEATNNAIYRGYLGTFRDELLHGRKEDKEAGIGAFVGLDDRFKAVRAEKPSGKLKADKTPIMVYAETEEEFLNRIMAENSLTIEQVQKYADELVAATPFDPSASERKPGKPPKLAEKWLTHAKGIIKKGAIEELNRRLHKQIGKQFTPTDNADADSTTLGWLVKEFADSVAEQTLGKL